MPTTNLEVIPLSVKTAFEESAKYFPTPIQEFQLYDKYSRYNYELGRRETWVETVTRATDYLQELSENKLTPQEYSRIKSFILNMQASPSMRLLAMAGPAARRNNMSIYNCSYLPLDSIDSFVEELLVAMAGCGVGFSAEKQYIDKLPSVEKQRNGITQNFVIEDSTEGWAKAFRSGLMDWFDGRDVTFNYNLIRKAGVPLKVKGGRASGPEPFRKLLDFTRGIILGAQGRKLTSLEAHDIACQIGECIVSGGVRRTALISLFDTDNTEMRDCKNGDLTLNQQRWMSNNSAVWTHEMPQDEILTQMYQMFKGERGEPGIFSRYNANNTRPVRRKEWEFGVNPCGEINLRPYQFCNLSIAIARPHDTLEELKEKVEVATIIGTIQAMAVNFPGLRPIWKQNCEEERLLGVDITGWVDNPLLRPKSPNLEENLRYLRNHVIKTNKDYAQRLGINQAAATTCVKPSGNSAILFNCSSGIHPRHYKYYIRNVRVQAQSPLKKILEDAGAPMDPENGQTKKNASTYVIHFPVKAPDLAIVKSEMTAIEQCNYWLAAKLNWTEHNPSVTITYKPGEIIDLIVWVNEHKQYIGGMSFLPADNAKYAQMPYEPISEEEFNIKQAAFPKIDFSQLYLVEKDDQTTSGQELACSSGVCSLDEHIAMVNAKKLHLA